MMTAMMTSRSPSVISRLILSKSRSPSRLILSKSRSPSRLILSKDRWFVGSILLDRKIFKNLISSCTGHCKLLSKSWIPKWLLNFLTTPSYRIALCIWKIFYMFFFSTPKFKGYQRPGAGMDHWYYFLTLVHFEFLVLSYLAQQNAYGICVNLSIFHGFFISLRSRKILRVRESRTKWNGIVTFIRTQSFTEILISALQFTARIHPEKIHYNLWLTNVVIFVYS